MHFNYFKMHTDPLRSFISKYKRNLHKSPVPHTQHIPKTKINSPQLAIIHYLSSHHLASRTRKPPTSHRKLSLKTPSQHSPQSNRADLALRPPYMKTYEERKKKNNAPLKSARLPKSIIFPFSRASAARPIHAPRYRISKLPGPYEREAIGAEIAPMYLKGRGRPAATYLRRAERVPLGGKKARKLRARARSGR